MIKRLLRITALAFVFAGFVSTPASAAVEGYATLAGSVAENGSGSLFFEYNGLPIGKLDYAYDAGQYSYTLQDVVNAGAGWFAYDKIFWGLTAVYTDGSTYASNAEFWGSNALWQWGGGQLQSAGFSFYLEPGIYTPPPVQPSVPEPNQWLMLIACIIVMGISVRRRCKYRGYEKLMPEKPMLPRLI